MKPFGQTQKHEKCFAKSKPLKFTFESAMLKPNSEILNLKNVAESIPIRFPRHMLVTVRTLGVIFDQDPSFNTMLLGLPSFTRAV